MKTHFLLAGILFAGILSTQAQNYTAPLTSTGGNANTIIDPTSVSSTNTGSGNTFLGSAAGNGNDVGNDNTFTGRSSGSGISSGSFNCGYGGRAGQSNSSGNSNTALGFNAGWKNMSGSNNTYLGSEAGANNLGSGNVFIGFSAGFQNYLDSNVLYINNNDSVEPLIFGNFLSKNLKFHVNADAASRVEVISSASGASGLRLTNLTSANTPVTNTGTGVLSVDGNGDVILVTDQAAPAGENDWHILGNAGTSASTNFVGTTDPVDLVFRRNNIRSGQLGLTSTTFGYHSGAPTSSKSIYIGAEAGMLGSADAHDNTLVGYKSGGASNFGLSTGFGQKNTFLGSESGWALTSGRENVLIGYRAGYKNASGYFNTFIGSGAGSNNVSGIQNIFIGRNAGTTLTMGSNTFTGSNNTFIGSVIVPITAATGDMAGNNTSSTIVLADGNAADPKQRFYIHSNGDAGIGLGNNIIPKNKLEIKSSNDNPSISGLRLTNLTSNYVPQEKGTKFLTVDVNGDVIMQSVGSNDTSIYKGDDVIINTGIDRLRTVTMGDNDLAFLSSPADKHGRIYIGSQAPVFPTVTGNYHLYVDGGILTEKVKVALRNSGNWADYVFADGYELMPLQDVETFIKENKHLPGVSSAEELVKEGLDLGEMQARQMEKIEELTLYVIEQNKALEKQSKEIEELKAQMRLLLEKK